MSEMIFLTTPMRSGSTLLSRMLSAHPDISMSYDSVNFFRFCYRRYDPIDAAGNLERLFGDMAHRLNNRFGIYLNVPKCISDMRHQSPTYASAYRTILSTLFLQTGKRIFGDKESMAWTRIPAFLDMFPEGRALIIVRDPRDVVTSFRKTTIAPGNDYLIALFDVIDAVNHAVRLTARHPANVYMVRFERLKLEPEAELRAICTFLGINYAPEMIQEEKFTDHSNEMWNPTESFSFPEEPQEMERLAPVGRWRRKIQADDLFLSEWLARDQIRLLGLAFSGKVFSQTEFDSALAKVTSTPLLREAFKRWCETGEGSERFPIDPTNPKNWDPQWVKNPVAFLA